MTDLTEICEYVMMRINALLDDELDDQTADEVRRHIVACDNCEEEVEIWVALRSAVRRAYPSEAAPQSVIDRVTQRIHQLQQTPS
ncbi:MAG: zf-HC2 domain-containing protein [Propionibacteriaceae bacterium]|jgi:anti-sigma factor (TIGR02949 family)|nr:zf-HC2 domain-containing protein [Propionibacteriaceae bacterium]